MFSAEEANRKVEVFASVIGCAVAFSKVGEDSIQILTYRGEVPQYEIFLPCRPRPQALS